MLERTFTDDGNSSDDTGSGASAEPEYTFEGFTVEFSRKIMLTPPAPKRTGRQGSGPGVA